MKNWKTTLCGAIAAAATWATAYDFGVFNWKTFLLGLLAAVWGFFQKDSNVTGGTKQQ